MRIATRPLGQAGFRFQFGGLVVYVDPYLSDSVERAEGPAFARQVPIPLPAESVTDADLVLVSHAHLDHCDSGTLPHIAKASPACRFLGPPEVRRELARLGIAEDRILAPRDSWARFGGELRVRPVPAAHPRIERDSAGEFRCIGFVLDHRGRRIYHAGDTSPHALLLAELRRLAPIHVAILPVNESSFYKSRLGIVGNMSIREAFQMAEEIGVETLVPMHWDMFAPNSVHPQEIDLLYRLEQPDFELRIAPEEL